MDLSRNKIPENVNSIHLIAACGTGMGALACLLKDLGKVVTGSDQHVYPPMSSFLTEKGVHLCQGYSAENLDHKPDLVVVGNAVSKDNPEVVALHQKGLYYCSMPQALNTFAGKDKQVIMVTGTHGKTTTSALIAWLLDSAGLAVSFFIGGILANFGSNYKLGRGDYLVVEGDEYDTAYFDKGPKFRHYDPIITILTSVEFDHADIFDDLDHIKATFADFISGLHHESMLVAYQHDVNVQTVLQKASCGVLRYGFGNPGLSAQSIAVEPPWTVFDVYHNDNFWGRFRSPLPGEHNLANVLAAIAVAKQLQIPTDKIQAGLSSFRGVKRRQEIRGICNDIVIIDDFAHHPTAVQKTIQAIRGYYPHQRLVAVFEPRTNTSMRNVFQDVYARVFDDADLICIREPALLKKIPSGQQFSSQQLVAALNRRGLNAIYFEDTDRIIKYLASEAQPGDVILVMSNGGFDNIHQRLLDSF
jgi:UDP-N-acetylmuramate: L-alanyl-gamma-D-glutamyl-meso-diaminopimelate ligase